MSLDLYLAFLAACIVVTVVPGQMVTLVVANSLTHGTRAGLLNVFGAQFALGGMTAVLMVGLGSIVATMGWWFEGLRLVGAAYLIWLGWKLLRPPGMLADPARTPAPREGFFLQGFLVMLSNPKALLFFGAFFPQFLDPKGNYVGQLLLMGLTAMVVAILSDGMYAVLSGRAGALLSRRRTRLLSRASGAFLIGGGIWLALARSR